MADFPLSDYGFHSVYRTFSGIALEQTLRCPNMCVFCAKARDGHTNVTMSRDDLDFVLDLLPSFAGWVALSGSGDAMLVDDLPERIARIKAAWHRCRPGITTTLTFRRDKSFFQDLFGAGLNSMLVSCYGHTAEDHKKIHGSSLFSVVLDNLRTLGSLPRSMTKNVVLRNFTNAQEAFGIQDEREKRETFFAFARSQGIERFNSISCFPWNPGKKTDGEALWQRPSPCPVVWGESAGELIIHANLDVVPCCMMFGKEMVLGNLRNQSLAEMFSGETYRSFHEKWWNIRPGDIPYCNTCQFYSGGASRGELDRMSAWQVRELRGKKVIFWGAGEAYRAYKSFFVDCEPVAILVDSQREERKEEIDGIPLYHPDEFLPTLTEPLPLVIFAMQEASPKILRTLKEKYGTYKPSKLVICPANAHIEAPVQPFFQD